MRRFLLLFFFMSSCGLFAQEIKSPSEFLGYDLGSQFTHYHEVVDYYKYVANAAADRVQLKQYGKTNEHRPLLLAYISSAGNMQNLESIRAAHIKSTLGKGNASKAIVWLSYNVHGNESVGTEASMQTLYELLTHKSDYLKNTVVIIDPCVNPDGRERYVNWYSQFKNTPNNVDPNSKEHHEGWLDGRSNHYMFDLNRDWAWLTQIESQQRIKMYNQWLPHIHVDFHEQGVDNPYYFAPAAEPFHEVITRFQRDFQAMVGKNNAKYFDENGWFYFTKEVFDMFYPSYGDTYPTYTGSIGMTYEQGGSGDAGLGVITRVGDTLTLKDRMEHHLTTGLSTVEVAAENAITLNEEFKKFYEPKNYKYKSYVMNGNLDHLDALTKLLDQHEITYGWAKGKNLKGFNYATGKKGALKASNKNLVVSIDQPKGTLVKVLFEPNAKLSDSLTYDITAWSLPYAYGLNAVASESPIPTDPSLKTNEVLAPLDPNAYAFLADWNSMEDARFLAALLQHKIRVRYAQKPFSLEGKKYARGSLIIAASDNKNLKNFIATLQSIVRKHHKKLDATTTGMVEKGKDFGSDHVLMIPPLKIALLSGEPTNTLRFGEIWHFFEQQLQYPVSVLNSDYFKDLNLSEYNILILPGGSNAYKKFFDEKTLKELKSWVQKGGKLIAMGSAIKGINTKNGFKIKTKKVEPKSTKKGASLYGESYREQLKKTISGAIFKAKVDPTHPLAFGYGNTYYTLKLGSDAYEYPEEGNVVYIDKNAVPVAGFAGSDAQKKMEKTMVFGVEKYGRGQVIYMVDNPLFRGFWENGKLFFANALFMVR